ncbi:MAG: hypothetical protein IPJ06_07700 [Saprospiraceae bacterium]|nr:hypothetical protein [Saprospiraceae bacterium]
MKDSTLTHDLGEAAKAFRNVSVQAEKLTTSLDATVRSLDTDIKSGGGPLHAVLRDDHDLFH